MFKKMIFAAALVVCATGASAAPFTMTSPTSGGDLPSGVSVVGGIVFDAIGLNGARVTSQLAASSLFEGFASSNPLLIGTQTGFDSSVTNALGGGIAQLGVRITLDDGDSAPGNFDDGDNTFLVNGFNIGNFSDVDTVETDSLGNVISGPDKGFNNNDLDTGFFFTSNASTLAGIFAALVSTEEIAFALNDVDFGDNFYDFKQGIDSSLINTGTGPVVTTVPLPAALPLMLSGIGMLGFAARRKKRLMK